MSDSSAAPSLIVHGGAWDIPPEEWRPHREGCERALAIGLAILEAGGAALDAVEGAVRHLEDDPTFDAGRGSFLNEDGDVELDAGIMDGTRLDVGAVAAVQGVRNAVTLARRILESEHWLLVGEGARRFAQRCGIDSQQHEWLVVERERMRHRRLATQSTRTRDFFVAPGDTVGAVARDARGNIAAATSTGGTPNKPLGRVGDAPVIGAGYYADSAAGGASATGWGESIVRLLWCFRAVGMLEHSSVDQAASSVVDRLALNGGAGGIILLDRKGRPGIAYNTPAMAFAYRDTETGRIVSGPHEPS